MLRTERLILKPMTESDASHLLELNSDPDVVRYTGDVACTDLNDALKIVTERSKPQFEQFKMGRFSVFLHDGTYLGWCGLKNFPEYNEVDLGYRFHKRYWGKGYATEASLACLKYGFEELKLKRIIARVMPANIGSIKVVQRLKMNFRGLDNSPDNPPGFVLYDLLSSEFKS